jgi:hypothetical protein
MIDLVSSTDIMGIEVIDISYTQINDEGLIALSQC